MTHEKYDHQGNRDHSHNPGSNHGRADDTSSDGRRNGSGGRGGRSGSQDSSSGSSGHQSSSTGGTGDKS